MSKVGTPREVFEAEANVTEDVILDQFVADDTSNRVRNVVVGAAIVAVVVAWAVFAP